jgi:hypothetical protein
MEKEIPRMEYDRVRSESGLQGLLHDTASGTVIMRCLWVVTAQIRRDRRSPTLLPARKEKEIVGMKAGIQNEGERNGK